MTPRVAYRAVAILSVAATIFVVRGLSAAQLVAYVKLQATTGTAQTGNSNISGTSKAGYFSGNGSNLTKLNASNITSGYLSDLVLSTNVPRIDVANIFTAQQNTFFNVRASQFLGSGAMLTSLNAANISTGTLSDTRLSSNVPRLDIANSFTGGTNTFDDIKASAFIGNGAQLTNLKLTLPYNQSDDSSAALLALANTGSGAGLSGAGGSGFGVVGTSNSAAGGYFTSQSSTGVSGISTNGLGVLGSSQSSAGGYFGSQSSTGVSGISTSGIGVLGSSQKSAGGYFGSDSQYGVKGISNTSVGVVGVSTSGTAGYFSSQSGTGVSAISGSAAAFYGQSSGNTDVFYGYNLTSETDGAFGTPNEGMLARGRNGHDGVTGNALDGGVGVVAATTGDTAALVLGNLSVQGSISKGGGSFKIDHPQDPANKYLYHSFVESPDMKNIYDGVVTTDQGGFATVSLPSYFQALNSDFRYQLTVIGQFAQAIVATEIQNNSFTIQTNKPNVKVSWQVTGIRKDPWAMKHRIPVEQTKSPSDRGYYLYPDAYGLPDSSGIYRNYSARLKQTSTPPRPLSATGSRQP